MFVWGYIHVYVGVYMCLGEVYTLLCRGIYMFVWGYICVYVGYIRVCVRV